MIAMPVWLRQIDLLCRAPLENQKSDEGGNSNFYLQILKETRFWMGVLCFNHALSRQVFCSEDCLLNLWTMYITVSQTVKVQIQKGSWSSVASHILSKESQTCMTRVFTTLSSCHTSCVISQICSLLFSQIRQTGNCEKSGKPWVYDFKYFHCRKHIRFKIAKIFA